MKPIIMDSGPLIAWFCVKDRHHDWALRTFEILPAGVIICEAVITEVCHLIAKDGVPPSAALRLIEQSDLILKPLAGEISEVRSLMDRYADTPMDFADACVTHLAELHNDATVCTTDTDFMVYRVHGAKPIPLLAPFCQ